MPIRFEHPDRFIARHLGADAAAEAQMLQTIGVPDCETLLAQTIPAPIRLTQPLKLPHPKDEAEVLAQMKMLASKNQVFKSYIGAGYYDCIVPPVILRNILENPGWYTQYTPYQAEIAQGRLEALLNYQTMVCDLTAMDIANASLLDEATAAAEAMILIFHQSREKTKGNIFWVSEKTHPQTIDVLKTRAQPLHIDIQVVDELRTPLDKNVFGILIQYPATDGSITDYKSFVEAVHENNSYVIVATDLLALTLLVPPGEWGADIVVGSSQRLGVPMGFGGPHAAFFAAKEEFKRLLPGRLIGVSIDAQGNPALRMALQTREQHIRREKATSNICTAQVLLAIMASMYAVYHGPEQLRKIAGRIHALAELLDISLTAQGYQQVNEIYFDTLRVYLGDNAGVKIAALRKEAEAAGINFRYMDDNSVCISLDETTRLTDIEEIVTVFNRAEGKNTTHTPALNTYFEQVSFSLPSAFARTSTYLTHPVFNSYHTETEMLRYIKRLEARDLSLAFSMISLGSCTMKLNATTEMIPVTFEGFGRIHPFAPPAQTQGYQQMIDELNKMLCEITGFAACSLQPNSGAQGEYTGLMVIREYLKAIGQGHRHIALIPASAHGTNPASAVMAGMQVVVVKTDAMGNIDVADLERLANQYQNELAALMITYPSTHGVFESSVQHICATIHRFGGQVYMDGANMNAQVGLTNPAKIGADVCHLNLHKTFCIPHGGGGPGMGPICVAAHLAPYLPGHPIIRTGGEKAMTAVSAAPYGSASILTISYAYILMMGEEGLRKATTVAILNANYIKARLEKHYPVLYQGENGRVAHELIIDMRGFKKAGIEVEDIAKRLIDYGFHAPTVSFPVPGTMMIEPTESESKAEIDRFCDALIAIRAEIQAVIDGVAHPTDNVLKNAPHTAAMVTANEWKHPYSREAAAWPAKWLYESKFWPFVGRVNNTHGDRNLVCTCPPVAAYAETEVQSQPAAVMA